MEWVLIGGGTGASVCVPRERLKSFRGRRAGLGFSGLSGSLAARTEALTSLAAIDSVPSAPTRVWSSSVSPGEGRGVGFSLVALPAVETRRYWVVGGTKLRGLYSAFDPVESGFSYSPLSLSSGTPSLRGPFAPRRLMGGITRGGMPLEDDTRLAAEGDVNRLA